MSNQNSTFLLRYVQASTSGPPSDRVVFAYSLKRGPDLFYFISDILRNKKPDKYKMSPITDKLRIRMIAVDEGTGGFDGRMGSASELRFKAVSRPTNRIRCC